MRRIRTPTRPVEDVGAGSARPYIPSPPRNAQFAVINGTAIASAASFAPHEKLLLLLLALLALAALADTLHWRNGLWFDGDDFRRRSFYSVDSVLSTTRPKAICATSKGRAKSIVAVQHVKLASREDIDRRKQFWSEKLDALAKILSK